MRDDHDLGIPGGVSRETIADLAMYEELLSKWNRTINLVSRTTLSEAWQRHFLDSAQLFRYITKDTRLWADLGSGAGFPGLVVATLAKHTWPRLRFVSVESDQRKAEFQRAVVRSLNLNAEIVADRIEAVAPLEANIVSARALAPLTTLLGYAKHHLSENGKAVVLKGTGFQKEIEAAKRQWTFDIEIDPSKTEDGAAILALGGIERA